MYQQQFIKPRRNGEGKREQTWDAKRGELAPNILRMKPWPAIADEAMSWYESDVYE